MSQTKTPQSATSNSKKMVVLVAAIVVALVAFIAGGAWLISTMDSGEGKPAAGSSSAPDPATAENREWAGTVDFNGKAMDVTLFGDKAPAAVASFLHLSGTDFFDGTACHRLTTGGFDILQCGDPTGTGT